MEDARGRPGELCDSFDMEREQVWILRQRAEWMGRRERMFLELVLDRGSSFGQIAHLMGQSEAAIRRRFRRLVGRLVSKETLAALRSRQLTTVQRSMARAHYLQGLSKEAIADRTGTSEYFVRKTLRQVQAVATQTLSNVKKTKSKMTEGRGQKTVDSCQ